MQCSQSIDVLKCTKKHVESFVNQIGKDTIDIATIPGTQKIHYVSILAPYAIETKEHYYSSKAIVKQVFKSVTNELSEIPETTTNTEHNPHKKLESKATLSHQYDFL